MQKKLLCFLFCIRFSCKTPQKTKASTKQTTEKETKNFIRERKKKLINIKSNINIHPKKLLLYINLPIM